MGIVTLRLCLKLYLCGSSGTFSVTKKLRKYNGIVPFLILKYNFNKPIMLYISLILGIPRDLNKGLVCDM